MLVQHPWLLFIQLQPLVPSCSTAVTESDLVNLKVSEQWPGPHHLGCRTLPQEPRLQSERTSLFVNESHGHRAGTQPPGSQLTSPTSQLPHERAALQSATAEHLPGSKLSPFLALQCLVWALIPYRTHTPGRCSQQQLHTAPLLFLLALSSKIWAFVFYFATPKRWASTEPLCSTENIKLKSAWTVDQVLF